MILSFELGIEAWTLSEPTALIILVVFALTIREGAIKQRDAIHTFLLGLQCLLVLSHLEFTDCVEELDN